MQQVSTEGYSKIVLINEQTGKINDKTVDMAKMVEQLNHSSSKINVVVEMVKKTFQDKQTYLPKFSH